MINTPEIREAAGVGKLNGFGVRPTLEPDSIS